MPLGNGRGLSVSPIIYTDQRLDFEDFVRRNWEAVVGRGLTTLPAAVQRTLNVRSTDARRTAPLHLFFFLNSPRDRVLCFCA